MRVAGTTNVEGPDILYNSRTSKSLKCCFMRWRYEKKLLLSWIFFLLFLSSLVWAKRHMETTIGQFSADDVEKNYKEGH